MSQPPNLLPVLAFLLAGCGSGEARSIQAEPAPLPAAQAPATGHASELSAIVRYRDPSGCGWRDDMTLVILRQGREILSEDYCSAYTRGEARVVTDATGRSYVLLEYSEGHGTGATSDFLKIFEVEDDSLTERAQLMIRSNASLYDYSVGTPPEGGMIVSGRWIVDGPHPENWRAPPRSRTVIQLDTVG